jgi:hypothetical protein
MEIDHFAHGDPVSVDLSGLYLGLCGSCAQATLMVPGGVCSACQAPETWVVRDPLLQGGHAIRADYDDV